MTKPENKKTNGRLHKNRINNGNNLWLWLVIVFIFLTLMSQTNVSMVTTPREMTYSDFYSLLQENKETSKIQSLSLTENIMQGTLNDGSKFLVTIPPNDEKILDLVRSNVNSFTVDQPKTFWSNLLFSLGPMLLLILFFWFVSYRGTQMGNKIWSFGKSKAKINNAKEHKITFEDVAGVEEAEEELQEIIEFLKDPKKF